MKSKNKLGWRLLALATVLFFLGTGVYFLLAPMRESKRLEQTLLDRYGPAADYLPPIDGFLPPERIEAFLRVREEVQPKCAQYHAILDDLAGLEEIDSNPQMPGAEKAYRGFVGFKGMLNATPALVSFLEVRNRALLQEGMGLGEYLYLYLAAYGPQIAHDSGRVYASLEESRLSRRAHSEFVQIIKNRLAALEATGSADSTKDLIADLREEVRHLEDGSRASPWPNGPTGTTRDSMAPYQEQAAKLYCAGIVQIELMQKNRGLNFSG